jgi:hypothetical protein
MLTYANTIHRVIKENAMTEREWMDCNDPDPMFYWLRDGDAGSDRKLRLFAVACCRSIWEQMTDQRSRSAVEVAERYADGLASLQEEESAAEAAHSAAFERGTWFESNSQVACRAAFDAVVRPIRDNGEPCACVLDAGFAAVHLTDPSDKSRYCELLRDILGNPFLPITLDPARQTSTVVALAHAAYENRTMPAGTLEPARLAVLADALEDAGCTDAEILDHLRGPGPHVRGCWVVDLLLDKK